MIQPISGDLQTKVNQKLYEKYQDRRKHDLEVVLSTEEGRRFLAGILEKTKFQMDIPVDNASKRDYLLGRRSVAVDIYQEIKSPENAETLYPLYEKLIREDIEDQNLQEFEKQKLIESFQKRS